MSTDDAYLAGLIDGEGHLAPQKPGRGGSRRICLTNTNLDMIDWVQARYGGRLYETSRAQPHYKDKWNLLWMSKEDITRILDAIEPYAVIKLEAIHALRADIASAPGRGARGVRRRDTCLRGHDLSGIPAGEACPGCRQVWNAEAYARRKAAQA